MSIPAKGGADRYQASTLTHFRNRLREFVTTICCGLSRFRGRAEQAPRPRFGVRYRACEVGGEPLAVEGGYRILSDKRKGIQPGFIAKRDWTEGDTRKLLDPVHKFHRVATDAVAAWLRDASDSFDDETLAEFIKPALALGSKKFPDLMKSVARMYESVADGPAFLKMIREHASAQDGFRAALASNIIRAVGQACQSQKNPGCLPGAKAALDQLSALVMIRVGGSGVGKFDKWHYVKLDYYESDKFFGKYFLPKDRSLGIIHRWFSARSAREHNKAAVREALANALMSALGIRSQKQKIVHAAYDDGTPKLLLDSTDVLGFKDFAGQPEKGERYLRDGVLVRNTQRSEDRTRAFTGEPVVDLTMPALGRNKILLLLLADRDAIGFDGGNKGYVGNEFIGIDSGEALTLAHLGRRGDVNSDFSFKHPGWLPHQRYKNFSMFDQSTFAEKMEGVRQIARAKADGTDTAVFNTYAAQFDADTPETDFSHDIGLMKRLYEGRREGILKTFEERLAVDKFHFGSIHHEVINVRRDASLNLLDGLEKLTSPTIAVTKNGIKLAYLQIADPSKRKEWHIHQEGDLPYNIVFSYSGAPGEIRKVHAGLCEFCRDKRPLANISLSPDGKEVRLTVQHDAVVEMQRNFAHEEIARHKHGSGRPPVVA